MLGGRKMKIFLDRFAERKLSLIYLLRSEDRVFSFGELAEKLQNTRNTIEKTLEALQIDLAKAFPDNCSLLAISIEGKEAHFYESDAFSLQKLTAYYLELNPFFRAVMDIFTMDFTTIRSFAEENYISVPYVYNRLAELNPIFEDFKLSLDFGGEFKLSGKERQIRYFYVSFFWNAYYGMKWPFDFPKTALDGLIEIIEELQDRALPISEREYYYVWLGVIVSRLQKGYTIDAVLLNKILKVKDRYIYDKIKQAFLKTEPLKQTLLDEEILQKEIMFFCIVSFSFEYQFEYRERVNSHRIKIITSVPNNLVVTSVNHFLNCFFRHTSLELTESEYNSFYINVQNLHYKIFYFEGSTSVLHSKKEWGKYYRLEAFIMTYMNTLFEELNQPKELQKIFSHKEELIINYTAFLDNLLEYGQHIPVLDIALLSIYGDRFFEIYKRMIRRTLYDNIKVSGQITSKTKLIIADRNYDEISNSPLHKMVWNDEPTPRDSQKLEGLFDEILVEQLKTLFF